MHAFIRAHRRGAASRGDGERVVPDMERLLSRTTPKP